MRKLLRTTAMATLAALAASASANTLFFQMNPNLAGSNDRRQVFLFGPTNTTGTLKGPGVDVNFDLGAEGFTVIEVPLAAQLVSGVVENKGFRIDSNAAISGYYLSRRQATTDMAYLIDGERLGKDHFVLGYQNIYEDQVSAQATQDNTSVTFTRPNGTTQTVTLNAGQTFMLTANAQLTGTRVTSDKPISVFSGNRCTNVPTGVTACDHIVEQMPPTEVLSNNYLLAQTPRTGTLGNVVRVVATEDNTEVRANGTLVATLNAGQFYEGRVAGGVELTANNKILVGQYLIGETQAGANTDPAMTIIPGKDQWLSSYVFAPPLGAANFPTDFIQIIIAETSIGSLRLDGEMVASDWLGIGSTGFFYSNIDVSDKSSRFTITAATPFQLLLLGFDSFDSYFTYGGAAFAPGASPPPVDPPPSDTVDVWWDGDGAGSANNGVVDGGDGVLTRTSGNLTTETGATNNALPSEPANIIFAGSAGNVTVSDANGAITVAGLEFRVDGYVLGGDSLTLATDGATLRVGNGTASGADFRAIINGALEGSGRLTKTDFGELVLTASNSYSGGTTVAGGTLTGHAAAFGTGSASIADGATMVFDQAQAGEFAAAISGAGALIKRGAGNLLLSGSSDFSGSTLVEAGRLDVTGTLADSGVTVAGGGTLGGTGIVGAVDLLAGSRIAPGLSIGSLTVDGNIAFGAGSIYQVELTSTGLSDRIVASGAAGIAPGAGLQVVKLDAPRFELGTRYTVLTAAGGRSGTFTLSGPLVVSQFISVVGEYDANNAYLAVRQTSAFNSVGGTPNQMAAATGVDNSGNGQVYRAIAYLPNADAARAAFDLVSGEIHASVRGATFEDTRFVREAVGVRADATPDTRNSFWMHGYGAWGTFDGDGNAATLNRNIGGVFFGADLRATDNLVLGILGGYGEAEIRVDARASSASTQDFHLGGYLAYGSAGAIQGDDAASGLGIRAGIANMWRDVSTTRNVSIPGYVNTLSARYDLGVFQMWGDVGWRFDLGAVGLEPFGSIAWVKVGDSDFIERGGSGALRSADGSNSQYWTSLLGGRAYLGLPMGGGRFGVTATAAWQHVGGDTDQPLGMIFGSGPAFDISGFPIAGDAAALGFALTGRLGQKVEVDVGYSGRIGSGVSDHGVRGSAIIRF